MEEYLYDYYGYDVDEYPLQGLACVQVKTVEKQDGDTDTMREDIMTAKVGGKWYIIRTLSKSEVKDVIAEAE